MIPLPRCNHSFKGDHTTLFPLRSPKRDATMHNIHPPQAGIHNVLLQKSGSQKAIAMTKIFINKGTNQMLTGLCLTMKKQLRAFNTPRMKRPNCPLIISGSTNPSIITDRYTTTPATDAMNVETKLCAIVINK